MPHGLVHESEEKLRAHFLHTGTPSATGLLVFSDFLQLVAIFRCALREAYSASVDLLAEFKGEGKYIVERNG